VYEYILPQLVSEFLSQQNNGIPGTHQQHPGRLLAPTSFQMDTLLREMHELDTGIRTAPQPHGKLVICRILLNTL